VADVNTPFLLRALHSMGWAVMRVAMLPDDVAAISHELRTAHTVQSLL
jgi:molybdopterin-biosynthesis enzyme MoeA-like protein